MFTYCLFCETQQCAALAGRIPLTFPCRTIYPQMEQLKWVKRQPVRERHPLLPGYIFLYADQELERTEDLFRLGGVLKRLGSKEDRWVLRGEDEAFAMMLLEKDGVIGKTPVYQEGDMIHIRDGAYKGLRTQILRVDRRSKRMQIQIPFANREVVTWVEYELVGGGHAAEGGQA